jgi:hypothetical protein
MTRFAELDDYLSGEFGVSEWGDDAVDYAYELVMQMTGDDWRELSASWQSRPTVWQERCAGVVGAGDERAIPLLLEMIQFGSKDVSGVAADSLRDFATEESKLQVSQEVMRRIQQIAEQESGVTGIVVKRLLRTIVSG